jgi:hypothetical protein
MDVARVERALGIARWQGANLSYSGAISGNARLGSLAIVQSQQMILLTANRNSRGEDSLEVASRKWNRPDSLPVITIADADRLMADRKYAERVASRIMDLLADIDHLRGTRRLFVR